MGEALCHLCQRPFPTESMYVDADNDRWCHSADCHRVALDRLRSPRSPYRQRREVARLEYRYGPPVDPMELFNLATPAEIFNLDSDPKPGNGRGRVEGVLHPPRVLAEQLSLLDGEAA